MSRSLWKAINFNECLLRKVLKILSVEREDFIIKIWDRSLRILPEYVNCRFRIYNGKEFSKVVKVKDGMVGLKFGSLFFTRKYPHHTSKNKNKKKV